MYSCLSITRTKLSQVFYTPVENRRIQCHAYNTHHCTFIKRHCCRREDYKKLSIIQNAFCLTLRDFFYVDCSSTCINFKLASCTPRRCIRHEFVRAIYAKNAHTLKALRTFAFSTHSTHAIRRRLSVFCAPKSTLNSQRIEYRTNADNRVFLDDRAFLHIPIPYIIYWQSKTRHVIFLNSNKTLLARLRYVLRFARVAVARSVAFVSLL